MEPILLEVQDSPAGDPKSVIGELKEERRKACEKDNRALDARAASLSDTICRGSQRAETSECQWRSRTNWV